MQRSKHSRSQVDTFCYLQKRDELEDLIALIVDLDMKGLNVTIPHKQSVMELMDELDGNASKVGAVNTIVNNDGKLIGKNTDITGFARSLTSAGVSIADKRALIIGAGGAARACWLIFQAPVQDCS